ncbi:tetratricopeptide repeat protein [bacterium]|nr:tetratricopeptide repeat protein [bacterium]
MTKLTIDQALQRGVEAHKAGQIQEADRLYTAIIKAQPKHPDANHNMGVLAVGVGKVEEALPFFKTALEANPVKAQYWLSYIDTLIKLDKLADAKAVLDQAKSNHAKGDGFDQLEQRLKETRQEPSTRITAVVSLQQPNILDSLKLDQAMKLAKKKAKKGSHEEAKRIYQDILVKFPKNKIAIDGLKGPPNAPIDKGFKAQDPSQQQLQALIKLYNQRQFQQVLQEAENLLQRFPKSPILFNIQGTALKSLGQLDAAIEVFKKALAIEANYADAHSNMGVAFQKKGELDQAIEAYSKAISINPNYTEAYYNLGNTLTEQNNFDEAIKAYNKAIIIKSDYPDVYNNMGIALQNQGKFEEAVDAYKKALILRPDYTDVYFSMGIALQNQGDLDKAVDAYSKALAVKPDWADAWSNGAEALEKGNKLEQLSLWLKRAHKIFEPIPSDIVFMKAKLLWRNKDIIGSSKLLSSIDFKTISQSRKPDFLNLRAKCYEASENFDLAFSCFSKMNSMVSKSVDYSKINHEKYLEFYKNQLLSLQSHPSNQRTKNILKQTDWAPVFLVGFPRSGTTLLDTVLRSHSRICVVEERPVLSGANKLLQENGYNDLVRSIVPENLSMKAAENYEAEFQKYSENFDQSSVYIDKLPLNLLQVPLITQLYPRAKFILALRHPMDTILSCWMQNFKLNPAMAIMVDLDRIVDFYCVAMETFQICRSRYNLDVYEIKYEELVDNLSAETSSLLSFLGLDWEDQMKHYQKTALKREHINTPSYSQVIQPIYKNAKYRWLNYRHQLEPYVERIGPWINEFYYTKT